jgi:heat shock gene repressor HrcA
MPATALDDRRREVLRALIQLHVDTGEPVGSENLSRALHRVLSPATLRNIMADLEALGYLDHPHTSAGRVPTDEGYRVYVDSLAGPRPLAASEAERIASELRSPDASVEQTMGRASHILSRLSRHVGFVLAPDIARTSFRHVDLVQLGHPRILVVMVSATGLVTHKVIEVEERLSPSELQACANYLNAHFAAQPPRSAPASSGTGAGSTSSVVALGGVRSPFPGEASVYLDSTSTSSCSPSSTTPGACGPCSGPSRRRAGWCESSTPASPATGSAC